MMQDDARFGGSIPELYERLMVPMLFAPYAAIIADEVTRHAPRRVLETAAGTGALTRALLDRLPPDAEVTATDLNAAMMDYGAAHVRDDRLVWASVDAQALPFPAHAFDAVACAFGVMFFPDQDQAHREVRRVLVDGGAYTFAVWDDLAHNDFARAVHEAAAALFPANPPQFIARTPHGYADVAAHERRLRATGFSDVVCRTIERPSRAPSARVLAAAVCQGTPLRGELEARDPDRLDAMIDIVSRAVTARFGDGAIAGTMSAHLFTAR